VLAKALSNRHYEVYRKIGDLDYRLKPFDKSLSDIITQYKGAVSKSRGYDSEFVKANRLYWDARTNTLLKPKHFERLYKVSIQDNGAYIGEISVSEELSRLLEFITLHGKSDALIKQFLERLGDFLNENFEVADAIDT
ncbi:MAG: hypothetical protein JKX90_08745, partial [Colwellia sp.]|nr:hypothetical protein [Colwellia sp.]